MRRTPLPELFAELDLARSSYFYHRARLRVADKYGGVRRTIADIFALNHCCYGYRRIRASLCRQHVFISEKVVRRLMRQECLVVAAKRRRRYGSYLGEISPAPDNLINRDFQAAAPNEKWLTDITEFQIAAGKVYLSPIIDCFDGLVASWTIGTRPDAALGFARSSPSLTFEMGTQRCLILPPFSDQHARSSKARGSTWRPGWL
jgi:transposase InsO family protein